MRTAAEWAQVIRRGHPCDIEKHIVQIQREAAANIRALAAELVATSFGAKPRDTLGLDELEGKILALRIPVKAGK